MRARPMPALALIAAVARNGVIGVDGRLPWRLPEDLRRFRALTAGHSIIMGRRTWQSIGRALPGRQNIVVTRDNAFIAEGADVAHSFDAALDRVGCPPPTFCIGGGELYRAALPRADTVHVTELARDFDGDATFPALDPRVWRETARESHAADDVNDFDFAFVTYERVDALR